MSADVPRVALQTHLDGDPKPREGEIIQWDLMRRRYGLEQMIAVILLPDERQTEGPFAGYQTHSWVIQERDGKVRCERQPLEITIVPD